MTADEYAAQMEIRCYPAVPVGRFYFIAAGVETTPLDTPARNSVPNLTTGFLEADIRKIVAAAIKDYLERP